MTIALSPNIYPGGWRAGSPIELVEQSESFGYNQVSEMVRVPDNALPGDVMILKSAWGGYIGGWSFSGVTSIPSGFWTVLDGNLGYDSNATVNGQIHYHIVQDGDQGKSVGLSWTQNQKVNVDLSLMTWRHAWLGGGVRHVVNGTAGAPTTDITGNPLVVDIGGSVQVYSFIGQPDNNLPLDGVRADGGVTLLQTMLGGANGFFHLAGAVDLATPTSPGYSRAVDVYSGSPPTNQPCAAMVMSVLLPPMPPPPAPTLTLTPSGSSIDAAGQSGTPLAFTLSATPILGQGELDAWFFGRQPHAGGAVQWWNADANLWTTSGEYPNIDLPVVDPASGLNTFKYTFPAVAWADDATNWDVAAFVRVAQLGSKSPSSTVQTFTADVPPVVTGVTVTNPNSATPTIGWTESITRPSSVQTQYRARLFTLAATLAAGFDPATSATVYASGLVTSAALSQVTTALAGGQDLVPYVQIVQTGGQVSAWKAGPVFFNNQGAALAVPSVTASPSTDLVSGAPQVAATITGSAATAIIESSDDGGATWATVRDASTGQLASAVALAGSPTIYDGEAPPGVERLYRATGYSAAGAYPRSASSSPVAAIAPVGQFWLRRPLTGDSMLLKVTGDKIVEKMHEDATRYPIGGRKNAVWVRESPVHGVTLKFSVYFTDQGSSDKFDAMRAAQETLLLQSDTSGKQWYIALPPEPERPLRLTGSRLAGKPIRDLELEVDEQDRPMEPGKGALVTVDGGTSGITGTVISGGSARVP